MHKAQTAAQVCIAVPGLEAGAQWRERFGIGTEIRRAELQQIRHHKIRLINLIVHDHALQVRCPDLAGLGQRVQTVQGKA
ncbi:hypothetical protein D3C85_1428360 [compost metagenome]